MPYFPETNVLVSIDNVAGEVICRHQNMLRLKSESTILPLCAKDKRTGKEQKIRIEAGQAGGHSQPGGSEDVTDVPFEEVK